MAAISWIPSERSSRSLGPLHAEAQRHPVPDLGLAPGRLILDRGVGAVVAQHGQSRDVRGEQVPRGDHEARVNHAPVGRSPADEGGGAVQDVERRPEGEAHLRNQDGEGVVPLLRPDPVIVPPAVRVDHPDDVLHRHGVPGEEMRLHARQVHDVVHLIEHRGNPVPVRPVARRRGTEVPPGKIVERDELRAVGTHRLLQTRPAHVGHGVLDVEGLVAHDQARRASAPGPAPAPPTGPRGSSSRDGAVGSRC